MPLVVLGGSAYSGTTGLGAFQELDQVSAAKPVAKWTGRVDSTERVGEWIRLAVGKALEGKPGGVYLDFPAEVVARKLDADAVPVLSAPEITAPQPDPAAIDRVADLLAKAERPLILIGKGAGWAEAHVALAKLADMGIPYVCAPMARGTIPDDHPSFANAARSHALGGADVVVMIGGRFNWIFGMGRRFAPEATLVQVDLEAEELTSGAPVDLGIVADAKAAAEQLVAALDGVTLRTTSSEWLSGIQSKARANEASARAVLGDDSIPINPYRVVAEVRDALPRDAIVTAEGETIMGICRAMLPSYVNRSRLNAGTTGCMGVGAPYVVGSALACPDRLSVGILGDYAFGAAAMVVETAARVGAKPIFIVVNNEGIAGHMLQDMFIPAGAPRIASLLPARYDKIGEMVDAHTEHVETPEALRPAIDRAFASGRLSVVHILVDPKSTRISGSNYLQ
jgi:thiamine pyrophosphate-dependent acetolactate synthase large subunit-like protein